MGLTALRDDIDAVDRQLIELLQWRLDIAERIAEYKAENGLPVLDEAREAEKLARIRARTQPGAEDAMEELFTAIMKVSRDWQTKYMETRNG